MPDSTDIISKAPNATISTAAVADSTATAAQPMVTMPGWVESSTCTRDQAPVLHNTRGLVIGRTAFSSGLTADPRPMLPGYDSGVLCMILAIFLLIASNMRHYTTILATFPTDLFSTRTRPNAFDEHNTTSELRLLVSLILLVCLCEGIIAYFIAPSLRLGSPFVGIALASLGAGVYYLWQTVAYSTVGYAFATSEVSRQWLRGFHASQSILGLTLALPALAMLFNPAMVHIALPICALLYAAARIIFIFKGFRLFYTDTFSLTYFILYLCALEIVPVAVILKAL